MTESRQQKAEDASTRPARTGKLWKEKRAEGTSEDMQLSVIPSSYEHAAAVWSFQ